MKKFKIEWTQEWGAVIEAEDEEDALAKWNLSMYANGDNCWVEDETEPVIAEIGGPV